MWGPPGVMTHENVPIVHGIYPPNQNAGPPEDGWPMPGPKSQLSRHFFQPEKGRAGILNVKALCFEYPVSPF